MKTIKLLFLTLSITLLLNSCSDLPNEEIAETTIKETINEFSKGGVSLIQFKKTNGYEENVFGDKTYFLEFEGEIKYNKKGAISDFLYNSLIYDGDNTFLNVKEKDPYNKIESVNVNDTKKVNGKIGFKKKENGWEVMERKIIIKLIK